MKKVEAAITALPSSSHGPARSSSLPGVRLWGERQFSLLDGSRALPRR